MATVPAPTERTAAERWAGVRDEEGLPEPVASRDDPAAHVHGLLAGSDSGAAPRSIVRRTCAGGLLGGRPSNRS
jgi:hypothetical protein